MSERSGIITMHSNPLTLVGSEVAVGDAAPDVELTGTDMSPVKLSSFKGKVCVISAVPSVDTPVCDIQSKMFNNLVSELGKSGVAVVTVSMDLPFAQGRWCGMVGLDNATMLSDHRLADFGEKFGVLIKELRLLSRAVFVLDKEGVVKYIEIVPELTNEPDYDAALKVAKELL